ncbi:MAG: DNA polymerase III subunit delta [Patescibacteria group bacterium]
MIILLTGSDTHRARQRLDYYRDGFRKKYDPTGLNVTRLDGATLTIDQLRAQAGQTGFLSTKRFLSVENVITRSKKKKLQDEIVAYLDGGWTDDNVLIFLEELPADRRAAKLTGSLAKRLSAEKTETFPLLVGEPLNRWIQAAVKSRGGRIASSAVLELASLVGSDLWNMSNEIDKLVSYRHGQEIRTADVGLMVRAAFDENIFHLTDALAARDARLTFRLLSDQLAAGANELYLLTMLTRQFRILLQTREIIDREPNYYTVATRLGIHPFVAQKAIRDARRYTLEQLKDAYRRLLACEVSFKSSGGDPRLLFDLLVMRVCGAVA